MTEISVPSDQITRSIGAAAEALLVAGGKAVELKWIFERSEVPMMMVDGRRRYVVNRAARLMLELSLGEMRTYAIDDPTSPHLIRVIEQTWERRVDTGSVVGRYQVAGHDGDRVDIVYCWLTDVVPELQLIAFAQADWPGEDSRRNDGHRSGHERTSLTPRETEMLALAADGLGGPELARELALSPNTINAHFKNIYEKLEVRNRAAAVAKAMRLGMIA